jgi:hypothetical protein
MPATPATQENCGLRSVWAKSQKYPILTKKLMCWYKPEISDTQEAQIVGSQPQARPGKNARPYLKNS